MAKQEIRTARIGDKLIVVNGVDPLSYVDLTKVNKGRKSQAVVRYPKPSFIFRIVSKIKREHI